MLKTAGAGGIGVLMGASGLGGFLSLTEASEIKEQSKRRCSFLRDSIKLELQRVFKIISILQP